MDASARPSFENLLPSSRSSSTELPGVSRWQLYRHRSHWAWFLHIYMLPSLLVASLVANLTVMIVCYKATSGDWPRGSGTSTPFQLYSPAQDAVEHKLLRFESGIYGGETPYQGPPTDENNELWQELYAHETSHISADMARRLPNQTSPELHYEGSGYLVVLNVFHNLHCLDSIRQAFYYFVDDKWNAVHNPYVYMGDNDIDSMLWAFGGRDTGRMHVDHCIDALRQSVMCTADITPNVFQWSDKAGDIRAMATVVHECRNFDKIKEWAKRHRAAFQGFGVDEPLGKCARGDPWTCLYE